MQRQVATNNGSHFHPCTKNVKGLHAWLSPNASSLPEGTVTNPLKSTMRCSVGGCGFRATYLQTVGLGPWAARSCRRAGKRVCITTQQAREATPEHFCQQSVTRTIHFQEELTVYETRLTTHNLECPTHNIQRLEHSVSPPRIMKRMK